LIVYYELEGMW